ncbi:MAG: stage III sporulation protein AA [Oscillospiraceae bacterium]|nr:stage III sporulation protein AA [Oscillospiraceae bacterium]
MKRTPPALIPSAEPTFGFGQAVLFLPMFKDKLLELEPRIREGAREIRLRAGQPLSVELINDRIFINAVVTFDDLKNLIELFCDYSVHSYTRQLSQGFITLRGGHRAGFCGTAVTEDGTVKAIRDITSINLRIARQFKGCSDELFGALPTRDIKSLLIIGRPVSAKTTILRDFAGNLSRAGFKVAVIDERGELSAKHAGLINADLGANTDVLDCFPKRAGFITALRALSPDFIICDEIADDGADVSECLNSGVGVVMTAHCGSLEEALCSRLLSGIIECTNYIALLGTGREIGRLKGLWRRDAKNENGFSNLLSARGDVVRNVPRIRA